MTDPRTKIAEQLGLLIIANIEQAAHIESLAAQLQQAQQAPQVPQAPQVAQPVTPDPHGMRKDAP